MIRKAKPSDVKSIHRLISEQAHEGHLLARALSDIYSQFRDFTVIDGEQSGELTGCGALQLVWENLAEIRSLAVSRDFQRAGIGSALIRSLMNEAGELGIKEVFVLTYRQSLFQRMGFEIISKADLPHKIWADCIHCTKFPECNEIAMVGRP